MKLRDDQMANLKWTAKAYARAIRQQDWSAVRDYQQYGKRIAGDAAWRGAIRSL